MADELGSIRIKVEPDEAAFENAGRKAGEAQGQAAGKQGRVSAGGGAAAKGGSSAGDTAMDSLSGFMLGRSPQGVQKAAGALGQFRSALPAVGKALIPLGIAAGVVSAVFFKIGQAGSRLNRVLGAMDKTASDLNARLSGVSAPFAVLSARQELRQIQRDMRSARNTRRAAQAAAPFAELRRDLIQSFRDVFDNVKLRAGTAVAQSAVFWSPLGRSRRQSLVLDAASAAMAPQAKLFEMLGFPQMANLRKDMQSASETLKSIHQQMMEAIAGQGMQHSNELFIEDLGRLSGARDIPTEEQMFPMQGAADMEPLF